VSEPSRNYFVRSGGVGDYITQQNQFTITREAFCNPEFATLVESLRESVEALCQSHPDEQLDRIIIQLDYGVIPFKSTGNHP
jgi:hypothetical protein